MKAKRVKSLIALLLVVALMLPTMPFSFADPKGQPSSLEKRILSGPDSNGNYTIQLSVSDPGGQAVPETNDVVIVFDVSDSMDFDGGKKLKQAQAGAIKFVETILKDNLKNYNRVAVVSFADKVYVKENFTNDIQALKNTINGLTTYPETNIQAGLHQARLFLQSPNSQAKHKHVLLLSDGEPSASYDLKKENNYYFLQDFVVPTDPGANYHYVSKDALSMDRMNYAKIVVNNEVPGIKNKGEVIDANGRVRIAKVDPTNQAYSETKYLKNENITIRVVAYDLFPSQKVILQKIASENCFYESDLGEILKVFEFIADNFAKFKNVVVKDPIGPNFDLVGNPEVASFDGQLPTSVVVSGDRRLITWNIGDLKGRATLTYKVKLKPNLETATVNENYVLTNGETTFTYDGGGVNFVVPRVPIVKVTYENGLVPLVTKNYNYLVGKTAVIKNITDVGFVAPEGKTFDKWIDKNGNAVTGTITVNENTVLKAVWKDKPVVKVTVTAHAGANGTGTATNNQVIQGKTQWSEIETGLKAAMKANVGYKFSHWSYTPDGTRVVQATDKFTQPNTDVYAIFVIDNVQWANVGAKSNNETMGTVNTNVSASIIYNDTQFSVIKNSFNAQPKPGYRLVKWTVEKTGATITDSYKFQPSDSVVPSTPTQRGGIMLIAHFEKDPSQWYDITGAAKEPTQGSVTVEGGKVNVATGTTWGAIVGKFKATPQPGYKFEKWVLQNGTVVTNTYQFTANTTVYAVFVKDAAQYVTVRADKKDNHGTVTGEQSVLIGTVWSSIMNKFTAVPSNGFIFDKWVLHDGTPLTPGYEFRVATTVYATFKRDATKWIDVTAGTKGNGTATGAVNVLKGTPWSAISSNFTHKANPGYKFDKWVLENGTEVKAGTTFNANTVVYATFVVDDTQYINITGSTKPGANGTVTGGPARILTGKTWADIPSNTFKTTPSPGYRFDKWILENGQVVTNTTKFTTSTVVYATFVKDAAQWIDVTAGTKGNGTATGAVNVLKGTAWSAISSNFTHKANPGYKFDKWVLENGTEVKAGTTFNANTVVYATFVVDNTQYINISGSTKPGANGTVTGGPARILTGKTWADIPANTFKTTPSPGYRFDKWILENGQAVTNTTKFTTSTVVYATFVKDAAQWIDVTAGTKGNGTATGAVNVLKGTKWSAIVSNFSHKANPGYKFDKWVLQNDTPVTPDMTFNANTVVYAAFVKDTAQYTTVTVVVEGEGTISPSPTIEILKGTKWPEIVSKLTPNPAPGYEFQKWTDNAGNPIDPTKGFEVPTTVKAVFVLKQITVKVELNTAHGTIKGTNYTGVANVTLGNIKNIFNVEAKPGYVFAGWQLKGGSAINDGHVFHDNATVVALFNKVQEITITAEGVNGTVTPGTVTVPKGTKWPEIVNKLTPNPAPGYEFQKWTDDKGQPIDPAKPFNDPTTVKAVFVLKQITVKVELNTAHGTIKGTNYTGVANVTLGNIKNIFNVEAKPGYVFAGWQLKGGSAINDGHVFHDNATVVALFNKVQEITITAEGVNGTVTPGTVNVPKGTKWPEIVSKLTPNPAPGYEFQKWTDDKGQPIDPAKPFNDPTTVKAVFVLKQITVKVELNTAHGTIKGTNYTGVANVTLGNIKNIFNVEAKPGYVFAGWQLKGGSAINDGHVFHDNATVIALFNKVQEITITAEGVNGTVTPGTVTVPKGTKWPDIVSKLTPNPAPGYEFQKWTDDKGQPIDPAKPFNESATVKAVFVKKQITISVDKKPAEGGNVTGPAVVKEAGVTWADVMGGFTQTPNPGYKFTGWKLNDGTAVTNATVFNSDTVVYATYSQIKTIKITGSVAAPGGGKLTVYTKDYPVGTKFTDVVNDFNPVANPGYKVEKWTQPDGSTIPNDYVFTAAQEEYNIKVHFVKAQIKVTIVSNPADAADITGTPNPLTQDSGFTWGDLLKIYNYKEKNTAKYTFLGWYKQGATEALKPTDVFMEDATVEARFVEKEKITVKAIVIGTGGTVSPFFPLGVENIYKGTPWSAIEKLFTVTADPGKKPQWTLDNAGNNPIPNDKAFTEDTTVYVKFVEDADQFITVNAKVYLEEGGTVSPDKAKFLKTDTYAKLDTMFTPNKKPGYVFLEWVDAKGKALDPTQVVKDGDTVYAKFVKVNGEWIKITAKVIGEGEIKPSYTTEVLKNPATPWSAIKDKDFKPDPKPGHKFLKWVLNPTDTEEISDTQTFNDGDVVYAIFERDDAAHMNVLAEAFPPEGGTATPHLKNILKGTAWSLIRNDYDAKPNPGYEFIGWYVKDGNKLPMLGDDTTVYPDFVFNAPEVVIQAKFREISDMWIVVTGLSNGNGKVISGPAKVLKGSTWTQITNRFAVQPDAGYRFSHWTDQNGNRLVDTYKFDFSQNVYANFEPIPAPPTPGDRPNRPRDEYQEYNPPENTAINEDDVALGVLNYNDYYAYIQGYPDGSVRSSAYVNREETAAIFFRLLEPKYKETIRSENNNFKDITKATWSNKHISTLANGGIIRGYSDGTFRPRAAITRAELAVIAAKFDRVQGNTPHSFTDVKGHWAEKYIANANYKGWIKGYPSGEFRPDVPITRAEFVTFINKVLGRNVKKTEIPAGVKTFTDLHPNAWYYENMVTATNSYLARPGDDGYQKWSELVHIFIEM